MLSPNNKFTPIILLPHLKHRLAGPLSDKEYVTRLPDNIILSALHLSSVLLTVMPLL